MFRQQLLAAGFSAVVFVNVQPARAADSCTSITRSNLISCVTHASLSRDAGVAGIQAAEGRIEAATPWLPSSPVVSLTGARRDAPQGSTFDWSASLGIELEIAGQRGARRKAAVAEVNAERKNLEVIERSVATAAWQSFFDLLAAEESLKLTQRLEAASKRVWQAAQAAAERGVAPGVEADLAEAAHVRIVQRRIDAQRDVQTHQSELATLLGLDAASLRIAGALEPLRIEQPKTVASSDRPEVAALEAQGAAFSARASALRRSRVPNPTVSVFVQKDGFDEKVLGVGLAFPLPLPEPVGRMHSGEIAENEALARRAALLAAESRRSAKGDLQRALADYAAALEATQAYDQSRLQRSEATLASLAAQVEAGRLSTRDAVILQEPLFDVLLGAIESRRRLCVASADVAQAAGLRLTDGGVQ
jgi:cobalt-zinc-cadmium efflux system outer membrane protein